MLHINFKELNDEFLINRKLKILDSQVYIGTHEKYKFECLVCENIIIKSLSSILYSDSGCPICKGKKSSDRQKNNFNVILINEQLKDRNIECLSENSDYKNNKSKLKWKCLICDDNIWYANYCSVVNNNHGCLKCSLKNRSGIKHPMWKGGKSKVGYPKEWFNGQIQKLIRKRDNYKCQFPNCEVESESLDVHHIDENKENCKEYNLISLCNRHHAKVGKNSVSWMECFYNYTKGK